MTQQMFAQFLGMAPATLCSILNERTKPTLNTVEAIRNKFPNINIDWLMFGNGTMFVDDAKENDASSTPRDGMAGEQTLNLEMRKMLQKAYRIMWHSRGRVMVLSQEISKWLCSLFVRMLSIRRRNADALRK